MSFFNFFGSKNNITSSSVIVMQNLIKSIETLEKKEEYLEKLSEQYKIDARRYVKTNKQKAILLLKKVKMTEKQLLSIYGQKQNLETQVFTLQQGITNISTISSMKEGKTAIENLTKSLDVNNVGDLMDNIGSNMDMVDEITTIMSQPIGDVQDDDDLLAEFECESNKKLEKCVVEDVWENRLVIEEKPESREKKERDELDELILSMNV